MKLSPIHAVLFFLLALSIETTASGQSENTESASVQRFQKITLDGAFHSEGADAADLNADGVVDIVSGPFWYEGPDFRKRHRYAEVKDYSIKGYSDHFFSFARDFNGDGRVDIFSIPIPGNQGVWYENPGPAESLGKDGADRPWPRHVALASVDNESPTFADLTGDGVEELVCIHQGRYGYARPNPDRPYEPWSFVAVSENRGYGRFTHGLGVGDVDGDGKPDLLEKDGWWQQTDDSGETFKFHPVKFAQSGGSQMFAYDFDGDGDNDVLSVQNAHGYGLTWFERRGDDKGFVFLPHTIVGRSPEDNRYGVSISQMHAVALADIDNDGIKDVITGKRFWAHGGNDPGATELPVLYWFRTVRTDYGVEFQPHLIDARTGVGTQLTVGDIDGNGHVDVIVGNKLGTSLLLNSGQAESEPTPTNVASHQAGSNEFKNAIRTTEPLSPEAERAGFVVPTGFEVQLVAAEPDIAKPMNMAFDTRGRLWVSSSVEYPIPAAEGKGRDTIKILEDTDADGRADKITTFADQLNIPIGLYPYRDGVVCYSIPNIWFLRDTDGDGRCDKREILYGPFDYSRDTHGMCNGFVRGFDGWLYACHGFNNRSTVAGKDGHQVTMNSGNTFRMRLDGSRIEHFTDGQVNPFGMAIDPNGDLLTADCHTKPITLLLRGGVYQGFGKPHDGLGFVPNVMEHLHGSTAIGGIAVYHGGQFPSVFHGNSFGGNVMTSRVNRNSIHHSGSSLTAREESDFLISDDPWFRPVDLQVGPDGALYVADFYNRIIGHYEVGLDHPGRDRHRGRIWRIVYNPDADARRDATPKADLARQTSREDQSVQAAISRLASPNLSQRMLAADELADRIGVSSIPLVRSALESSTSPDQQVQLRWVLFRLGAITDKDLADAVQSEHSVVRSHAYQMLGAKAIADEVATSLLVNGLSDPDALARRSAAIASAEFRSPSLTDKLMETLLQTTPSDVHLIHAIRMSLRDHLKDERHFRLSTESLSDREVAVVIDLCLGIRTDFAGEYLAAHLADMKDLDQSKATEYLSFAARYASTEHLGDIAELAQERFADNLEFQEQLVRSVRDGLLQRGIQTPEVVVRWATGLARQYLGMKPGESSLPERASVIGWEYLPYAGTPDKGNPWVASTKRNSADGQQASRLHSSFPKGETLTGIYRSGRFRLPEEFSFYLAGHDGYPDKPIQNLNVVRVRDAVSRQVLRSWSPPRNDMAQLIRWETGDSAGREVFVELVDGDTAGAYAWLAVGRFSVAGLNPSRGVERLKKAAKLIGDFQLKTLRGPVEQIVSNPNSSPGVAAEFAAALVAFRPSPALAAVAESMTVAGLDSQLRGQLANFCTGKSEGRADELLGAVTKIATAGEQQRIAAKLSSDREGMEVLVGLVEAGKASTRLLLDPVVKNKLESIGTAEQQKRVEKLAKDLPSEDATLVAAMKDRKSSYLSGGGDVGSGLTLFTKHCNVCHQVAGKGVAVGPNLDGVGNRGLDRLIEDVLTPNRNIDAAFRASVVLTEDGRVVSGLIKRTEGAQLVIVDQTGKEIQIPTEDIVQQKIVPTSPMPANFHETLSDEQTRNLMAYLLSLTH